MIRGYFSSAVDGPPMWASAHVSRPPKKPSKMGFDEVSPLSPQERGEEVGGLSPPSAPTPDSAPTSPSSSRCLSSAWPAGPTAGNAC